MPTKRSASNQLPFVHEVPVEATAGRHGELRDERPVAQVALTEGVPQADGRRRTAEEYTTRRASVARRGMRPFTRPTSGSGRREG